MLFMLQIGTQVNKKAIRRAKKNAPAMHYVVEVICTNCLNATILTIPKGIDVYEYANKCDCPICGCKILEGTLE